MVRGRADTFSRSMSVRLGRRMPARAARRCAACSATLLPNVEHQLPACIAHQRFRLEQTNKLLAVLRGELEGLRRQLHNSTLAQAIELAEEIRKEAARKLKLSRDH